jgi:hypothetical protein
MCTAPAAGTTPRIEVMDGAPAALDAERLLGVETGGCPRTAIRGDGSILLESIQPPTGAATSR